MFSKFRILSEYLGLETMLAIVCNTHGGVKALEEYDAEGKIDCNVGLHGFGYSIGSRIKGRFVVICLEDLRQVVYGKSYAAYMTLCVCVCVCVCVRLKGS